VGKGNVLFQVHLRVLCDASPVFNAAFHGGFLEASNRSMDLPEDDPEAFERLVQWLYCKVYDKPHFAGEPCDDDQIGYMDLAKLYVAADKFGIIGLKNDVMDRWCEAHSTTAEAPFTEVLDYVYENTTSKSKLREVIVAIYVWEIDYEWYQDAQQTLRKRPEFATDVAIAMAQKMMDSKQSPFILDSSRFHEAVADRVEASETPLKA